MSVLIEALSVIVPRAALDAQYPGGTAAYLADADDFRPRSRWAVADDYLTSVSLLSAVSEGDDE